MVIVVFFVCMYELEFVINHDQVDAKFQILSFYLFFILKKNGITVFFIVEAYKKDK